VLHAILATLLAASVAPSPSPSPAPSNQRSVTFTSRDGSVLSGTISWPPQSDEAAPAFVLIGGSGMQDRDETIGPNKPLAEIATALNAAGLVVLRYDKRGVGTSTSATPLAQVTRQAYVDDVLAAVASLKNDPHVDANEIYLLGHSEGGELAMGAVLQGAPVRGIVLLSPLPMPYAQIDPRVEVAGIGVPILLLHGSKDAQVTTADIAPFVAAARAANRRLQYGELDGDNHLFAQLPAGTESTGAEYMNAYPLDPRVIAAIEAWLAETQ